MAIQNGITVRGMNFQTSWNLFWNLFKLYEIFILFYQVFVCHVSSKENIFISFHNKIWRYDDVTTVLWQNQIIVIIVKSGKICAIYKSLLIIIFISFDNKIWRYDDITTVLWQNQIIVIIVKSGKICAIYKSLLVPSTSLRCTWFSDVENTLAAHWLLMYQNYSDFTNLSLQNLSQQCATFTGQNCKNLRTWYLKFAQGVCTHKL